MSVFGSAKTNFSSEMSLITAASTFSDADYETGSDSMTPRPAELDQDTQQRISRSSSASSANRNYVINSQSSSVLFDKAKDSPRSIDGEDARYPTLTTTKSDSCLSQQSKAISDFMNEILRVEEQLQWTGEPKFKLVSEDSSRTDFYPATSAPDSLADSEKIDVNFRNSLISIGKSLERIKSEISVSQAPSVCMEPVTEPSFRESVDEKLPICGSMSETKNQIISNLAQVTCSKLFSKPGSRYFGTIGDSSAPPESKTTLAEDNKSQGEPLSQYKVPSQKWSQSSRRSLRSNGFESILRIDHELQPLNLKLSKLLAEFRAMNLRGKLGFVDACEFTSADFGNKFFTPEIGSFKHANWMSYPVMNETSFINKELRKGVTLEMQERNACPELLQGEIGTRASEASPESHVAAQEKNASVQISRSCEHNRSKPSEKHHNPHSRCCIRPRRSSQSGVRKRQTHLDSIKRSLQKPNPAIIPSSDKNIDKSDFVQAVLGELGRRHIDSDEVNKMAVPAAEVALKKCENESPRPESPFDEEAEESEFSCRGLISPAENRVFFTLPPASAVMDVGRGDSLSNNYEDGGRGDRRCEEMSDARGDCDKDVEGDDECSKLGDESDDGEVGIRTRPEDFS